MRAVSGVLEIADGFDLFLLDQFGVLHDGRQPYPGVPDVLRALKDLGKPVVIISNSGKRAAVNVARMERMGLGPEFYDAVVTSGEVAWAWMRDGAAGGNRRCLMISSGDDGSGLAGLDIETVSEAAEADLLLIAGCEAGRYDEDHYRRLIAPAAERGVPCICSNPDMIALDGPRRHFGPGRIAEIYRELGGEVRYLGKPYPEIYDHIITSIGPTLIDQTSVDQTSVDQTLVEQTLTDQTSVDRRRTLCVGDSIEHDVVGAASAGLRSLLVRCGILAGSSDAELLALAERHGAVPDFVADSLAS
jgi:HAD superfamily hydrolase (TIGR01459 family)